jgi:hypothetical protein
MEIASVDVKGQEVVVDAKAELGGDSEESVLISVGPESLSARLLSPAQACEFTITPADGSLSRRASFTGDDGVVGEGYRSRKEVNKDVLYAVMMQNTLESANCLDLDYRQYGNFKGSADQF